MLMFDCVILAAGASSRMRAPEGGPALKPLMPFALSTMIETAVAAALGAGCRAFIVVGNRASEVAAPFEAESYRGPRDEGRLLVVANPRWEEGLLGSIQSALPFLAGEAFFLAHADMPFVASEAYRALAKAFGPTTAIVASHGGVRGHPVLLPTAWIPEILALDIKGRLRDYIAGKPIFLVETGPGALRDIDTPEEYNDAMEGP
jgi:CTP:molybdopterin cytidylyltransferase MocA